MRRLFSRHHVYVHHCDLVVLFASAACLVSHANTFVVAPYRSGNRTWAYGGMLSVGVSNSKVTPAIPLLILPIMSEISVSPSQLSEELQLLTEFCYSNLDLPVWFPATRTCACSKPLLLA